MHRPVRLTIEVTVSRILILDLLSSCRSRRIISIKRGVALTVSVVGSKQVRTSVPRVRAIKVRGILLSKPETGLRLCSVVFVQLPFLDGRETLVGLLLDLREDEGGDLLNPIKRTERVQIPVSDDSSDVPSRRDMDDRVKVSSVARQIVTGVFQKLGPKTVPIQRDIIGTTKEEAFPAV